MKAGERYMVPIVSVVGKSGAGKTYVMGKMIAELKRRGYRVAAVKHSAHRVDLDLEGKDSWAHAQAGSDAVAISSPHRFALMADVDHDNSLAELSRLIGPDFDIILAEGFKQDKVAKIEVHRGKTGAGLLCGRDELLAVVSDEPLEAGVPRYSPEDARGIVDLIEEKYLKKAESESVSLYVDGRHVPLNDFVRRIFGNVLFGLVSTLKGVSEASAIDIAIRRKDKR
jgi:molybdopterin-guanine dinucleotide biosynthesis protein B